ncbi:MAG: hypothetical protein GW779_05290 [Candidatus Altiarchaeum hamiconexum]|uniref:Uncharacterized protein n=1 Tax=Candidatus Altarchaeum hamiconexum TaxID=1803513 RepID=A0A8J8CJG8_9ARCH|nr:hypothetical protein [Candidatus Altarchaeum hamiconexum]OIQ05064.1 MAG: hypothetical protein AUK59_05370 [Candidatus Altarchaeum sp. CG2_30_32_3053]PIN67734.1 MAG: hypothetical protein COV98_01795 [Candidatus Altarchaeum sp. CG12_big_fil_rev_8_21_14_0_65_33_22]PIV27678.1 MAG: hypothetical protein COS36_05025 [Candidatus Altarchaeum sp. CG03_land_8_20_14_0_80_32_618]PIX49559.1 MAG: hypothetical protein COZ53_00235 [Candidatus Altarchaeum sp. CG_4_8_14_3_um_filter_33_2054]PIZ29659.1 MAG: hyp
MSNKSPKYPASKGVKSKDSLYIPRHDGKFIRDKGGLDKNIIWNVEDVIDFIFPKIYQPRYNEIAVKFINFVLEYEKTGKEEITGFLKDNKYSRSTLENEIIPKLVCFGLLKREREQAKSGKSRYLILSDSLTFSNYLERIAGAWSMIVLTARQKRKVKKQGQV